MKGSKFFFKAFGTFVVLDLVLLLIHAMFAQSPHNVSPTTEAFGMNLFWVFGALAGVAGVVGIICAIWEA